MSTRSPVAQTQWCRFALVVLCLSVLTYGMQSSSLYASGVVTTSQYAPSQNQTLILLVTHNDEQHWLSLADIETLPLFDIEMTHPEGLSGIFTGVWLNSVIEQQGIAANQRIRLIALDNYSTFLDKQERAQTRYFLVTRLNGEPIALENMGPLMLIAPDNLAAVRAGTMPLTRWIWSIKELRQQ